MRHEDHYSGRTLNTPKPLTSLTCTQHTDQSTVQYSTVQCSTVQYSTVQYSTVQYSAVRTCFRWGIGRIPFRASFRPPTVRHKSCHPHTYMD